MREATRSQRAYPWQPLTMRWSEVAQVVFRRSESWLRSNLPDDFPAPDPAFGLFATEAVQHWVKRRFGLVPTQLSAQDAEDILIRRANGKCKSPLSH